MNVAATASAPGSIMITGEHAVVYGHPAIVCAIDQRIRIHANPLRQRKLEIISEIAPPFSMELDRISVDGPYRFVLGAVSLYSDRLTQGLRLEIRSEIDPTLGLGSSAAVTVACLGILNRMVDADSGNLHTQALSVVRRMQGRGSGADLAASLKGGMLAYRLAGEMLNGVPEAGAAAEMTQLPEPPVLGLRYCGYKTPTGEVLARIAELMQGRETEFAGLYARMGTSAERAIASARIRDWSAAGAHLTDYQELMVELGVSDPVLDKIIREARANPDLLAAKISGSGLGDCVLALGALPEGFERAPVATEGLCFDD